MPGIATSESMAMLVRETAAAREVSPSREDTLRMYSSRRLGSKACRLWDPIACVQYAMVTYVLNEGCHAYARSCRNWSPSRGQDPCLA